MANASQFIGCKISLISKSEIRYEGILYSLDVVEATISLAKVKSFGTEDRPTDRTVPPKDEIYEFIIFRGSDIKGIDVVEPPKPTPPIVNDGLPNDPAIVEVSHYHTSSRSLASANIGPVPVQVQVSSAYGATSGPSYGTSPFPSSNAASTSASAMSKPVSTSQQQPQPSRTGSMSSKVALESPEPVTRFEVNEEAKAKDSSGSQSSTPAFTTLKPEENQARLSYGGSARGRDHGFNREHRDERPRGGRGRAREGGYGSGRGRPQGSIDYTEGNDSTGGHRVGYGGGHGRPHNSSDYINTEEQDRMVRQRNQGGSYQPRGRGGAGNYSNASHIGSGGFRGGRGGGGFRNNRTQGILRAPQSAKVTFDNDFDFEKANEELQTAIKNLKLTEKNNEGIDINGSVGDQLVHSIDETEQQENREPQICYKKDDFFDSISCEALDRAKGGSSRPDWKAERKLNAETFGLTGRGRGSGGYSGYYNRGGGRGYYNNHGGGSGNYGGGGHRGNSRGGGYYNNNRFNGGGRRGRGISDSREESARGSGLF